MEFRILGPLEVHGDSGPLAIGHGKQRALLALLLLEANRVVSSDRLIDELWGERPPPTVAKALQGHVSALRKLLGAERIVTRAPGYELRVDDEELDLRRFQSLAARGAAAREAGDPAAAHDLLRQALALWRGPPLADVAFERFVLAEAQRLEELRLTALEERIEADLALGRHAELTGELEALVAAHPYREGLRAQQMLALYRCARQAEALECYRSLHRTLVEELGIEPGARLQELERAILNQDPALDLAAAPATPAPARTPVPDERKLVSVAMLSLGAAPDPDPERQLGALSDLEAAVVEEMEAAGGRVESSLGESLLVSFGADRAQEDHVERSLSAALAAGRRLGAGRAPRIGVESGEVLVSPQRGRGAGISGAPVIVAARLAAAAGQGEVRVGPRAAAAARGAFEFARRDGAHVLERAIAPVRPRGVSGLGRTFVGREAELAVLVATYERVARSGRPQLALVLGDAGVGKTSLLAEFRARLDPRAVWHVGRCAAYGRGNTYRPVVDVLKAWLGGDPGALRERMGDEPMLAGALGVAEPPDVHPLEAQERLHEAWVRFGERLAGEGPAVLVVEDVHWADEALVELLGRLSREVAGPLLAVATARPEISPNAWQRSRGDLSRLWLEPLSEPEAAEMLHALAGELPDEVRAWLLGRAEGNPFYLEEAMQSLLDHGVLSGGPGDWRVSAIPAELAASDSVQSVIAARLDRLPAAEKTLLQVAAVMGRSFREGAACELAGVTADALALLEERDFAHRTRGGSPGSEREWLFKHALTREVAYASLPAGRRARLHAAFAEWLTAAGLADDDHAALLANHYGEAARPQLRQEAWPDEPARREEVRRRALDWLARAGELAFARYEMEAAAAFFEQAAELESEPGRRVQFLARSAEASYKRFDMDRFRSRLEQALDEADSDEVATELYGRLALEGAKPFMWRRPPAREDVEAWIEGALRAEGPPTAGRASALIARASLAGAAGREPARQGAEMAERLGDFSLLGLAYETNAWVATAGDRLDEAVAWAEKALGLLPKVDDPDRRSGRLFFAVFAHLRAGRIARARALAEQHDAVAARLTQHHDVHGLAARLVVETIEGRWDDACALTSRALSSSQANLDTPCQFNWRALLTCALAHAADGRADEARALEERAAEVAAVGGPLSKEPALVRLALVRGDLEAVERMLAEEPATDLFDADYPAARLDALAALGAREQVERHAAAALAIGGYAEPFALRALGRVREDETLVEQAAARFEEMGLAWRAAETRELS